MRETLYTSASSSLFARSSNLEPLGQGAAMSCPRTPRRWRRKRFEVRGSSEEVRKAQSSSSSFFIRTSNLELLGQGGAP